MRAALLCLVVACGGGGEVEPDAAPIMPTPNAAREIVDTKLAVDVAAKTATATITFAASSEPGATLEIGDLAIDTVTHAGAPVLFAAAAKKLDLGLPASSQDLTVEIAYRFMHHEGFEGASMSGFTLVWPYFCGNVFPCHSEPADGTTFTLDLAGVAADKVAVFPPAIAEQAPSYQLAWAIGSYTQLDLGTTTAGTKVSVWHLPNEAQTAMNGGEHLVAAFDWLEKTIGPYKFGNHVGTVSVAWPGGAFGGMEHHPRWHIGRAALGNDETHVHEAAHGWYGDGIRIQCWEDFVLSEGTVSYLAARALDVVAPTLGTQTWEGYQQELSQMAGSDPVWPQSCGQIDVIEDGLFSRAPYVRGAFFYKALADKLGVDKVDQVLAAFYQANAGKAATMQSMLDMIHTMTDYDPTTCANTWLRSTTLPTPAPCP